MVLLTFRLIGFCPADRAHYRGAAAAVINSLDDSVIARLQEEFEAEEESPRQRAERRRQQAKVILNVLAEDVINMNWNQEEEYLKAFMKALKQIEESGNE